MRRSPRLKHAIFWTLLLTFGLWTVTVPGQSELDRTRDDTTKATTTDPVAGDLENPIVKPQQKLTIKPDVKEPKTPSLMQRIDQSAGTAVELIAKVLFRRIGSSDQKSIQYQDISYFYRSIEGSRAVTK